MPKTKASAPANSNPLPPVPPGAIRMAKVGGTIALMAAAAMSAQTLVALGHTLGYHGKIAWLLPASLDVYAGTSIWVGYRIPAAHPASVIARRDSVLALSLTVCCNALYHLLLLAGSQLPKPLIDTLLVLVGALPPLVVERIFHLQMAVRNGDGETATVPATPPAATPRNAPAATAAPVSATTPAPQPAATRPATKPVAKPTADNGSAATVATLVPGEERLQIVRSLVAEHGPEVPLAEITDRLGCHKSTASRLRAAINEENGTAPLVVAAPAKEVI